ncbi:MAG: hypothetical protein ACKO40_03480 [Planctomycetaceae bacterium]
MSPQPSLTRIPAALLPVAVPPLGGRPPRRRPYRLLVVGQAVMRRPLASGEPWRVDVAADGSLLPVMPRSAADLAAALDDGGRLGAALLEPSDVPTVGPLLQPALRGRSPVPAVEIYGWALLYQLAGRRDTGLIDPHDDIPSMPAFYESPAELADRQDHLAARGIPTRAIAVVSQRTDFDRGAGVSWNRYCPLARWRRAWGPALPRR